MNQWIRIYWLVALGVISPSLSAFELTDMCKVFPAPAQGWSSTSSRLTINQQKSTSSLYSDYYISGWNSDYINDYLQACEATDWQCGSTRNKLLVPFDAVTDYSSFTSCEFGLCASGASAAKGDKPQVTTYDFSRVNRSITINDFDDVKCGNACSVDIDDDQKKVTFTVTGNISNLIVNTSYSNYEVRVKFSPNYVVKDFTANVATTLDFTSAGRYLHHKLSVLSSGSIIELGTGAELNVVVDSDKPADRGFLHIGGNVDIVSPQSELDSVWINAPEGDIWFQDRVNQTYLHALISARYIRVGSGVYIFGAVSTPDLYMPSQNSAVIGQSACFSDSLPTPVAKYHLEGTWSGTSNEVIDESGNNHHGTAVNAAQVAADSPAWPVDNDNFGTCGYANLNRSEQQYIEVPHSANLSASREVSVSAWIYPKSYPSADLASIVAKDTNYEIHVTSAGYLYWYWQLDSGSNPAYSLYSGKTIPLNKWTHVVITYDAEQPTQAKMYLDGQLSAQYIVPVASAHLLQNTLPLQIGQDRAYRGFDGAIDEVQIFKSALSSAQVLETYNARHLCQTQSQTLALKVTPSSGSGIACDGIAIDFSLVDADTGEIVEGKGQSLFVETFPLSGRDSACWSPDGNMTTSQCKSDHDYNAQFPNGSPATVRGYIHSKFLNQYNITASVSSESLSQSAGPYEFLAQSASIVPSDGVDGNDFYQVAGREFPFRVKIRGSQGQGNQLNCRVIDIDGSVAVDFSALQIPSSSPHSLKLSHNGGGWTDANTQLMLTFVDGVAGGTENSADGSLKLKLDDAGIVDFTGRGTSGNQTLSATERFYFRPFATTFCAQSGALPSNTDEVSGGFEPAGTDVSTYLRAFNWLSSLDDNNDGIPNTSVTAQSLCNGVITQSYYTHNGYVAQPKIEQNATVYPAGGSSGTLTLDGVSAHGQSVEVTQSKVNQARLLNWNEVGTLAVTASQESYLSLQGYDIPGVDAEIGRFYPASFSISNSTWTAPTGQGGVAYLDQPYSSSQIEVAPFAIGSATAVSNYHLFADALKVGFGLKQDDSIANLLSMDLSGGNWSENTDGTSHWLASDDNATLGRNYVSLTPAQTSANGPFNTADLASTTTHFGLSLAAAADPASFDSSMEVLEQSFPTQPSARYGRMVMDSVSTSVDKSVLIPLRVEFWNGSTFETNSSDSASELATATSYVCKNTVWSSVTNSGSSLSGSDSAPWQTVSQGESGAINAGPDDSHAVREQVQFWMRLGDTRPSGITSGCVSSTDQPWLQYDWRGMGDEDPYTVVTFGAYRGNDRVIFRGEPGLIGQ